jgi:hypothetical protein
MASFVKKIMGSAQKYTVIDFGALKLMMFTCGILVGLYFPLQTFKFIWLIWALFGLSFVWIVYKTFRK